MKSDPTSKKKLFLNNKNNSVNFTFVGGVMSYYKKRADKLLQPKTAILENFKTLLSIFLYSTAIFAFFGLNLPSNGLLMDNLWVLSNRILCFLPFSSDSLRFFFKDLLLKFSNCCQNLIEDSLFLKALEIDIKETENGNFDPVRFFGVILTLFFNLVEIFFHFLYWISKFCTFLLIIGGLKQLTNVLNENKNTFFLGVPKPTKWVEHCFKIFIAIIENDFKIIKSFSNPLKKIEYVLFRICSTLYLFAFWQTFFIF